MDLAGRLKHDFKISPALRRILAQRRQAAADLSRGGFRTAFMLSEGMGRAWEAQQSDRCRMFGCAISR